MAEATTSTSSINSAAQVNDDLNALQQAPQTLDEATQQASSGTGSEAPNVGQQDNPSLFNDGTGSTNSTQTNTATRNETELTTSDATSATASSAPTVALRTTRGAIAVTNASPRAWAVP